MFISHAVASGLQVAQYVTSLQAYRTVFTDTLLYSAESVTIVGNRLYTTGGQDFSVWDISSPASPQFLGRIQFYDWCVDAAIEGNYAYLADLAGGVVVVDISRPDSLREVGSIDLPDAVYQVKVRGNRLYAQYDYLDCPLAICDITQPTSPQLMSIYYPPATITDFDVVGTQVYVADGYYGVRMVDATDGYHPVETESFNRSGPIRDVQMVGLIAAVNQRSGIRLFDLTNPRSPVMGGLFEDPATIHNYRVAGNTMVVQSCFSGRFSLVNIADIQHPTVRSTFQVDTIDTDRYLDFELIGNYCYVASYLGIDVVDLTDPTAPIWRSRYEESNHFRYLTTDGTTLYSMGDYSDSIFIFDLSNPGYLTLEGTVSLPTLAYSCLVAVHDGYAYLNHVFPFTVIAVDIRDLSHPVIVDSLVMGSNVTMQGEGRVDRTNDLLLLPLQQNGSRMIDISHPSHMAVLAANYADDESINTDFYSRRLVVADRKVLSIYDYSGMLTVEEAGPAQLPTTVTVAPAYPNPFNATTTIRYSLPSRSNVKLNVFDATGREVASLVNTQQNSGSYTVHFNGTSLASGIYFVKLTAGSSMTTQKIVLLR